MMCQRDVRGAEHTLCDGELRFQHMLCELVQAGVAVYKCMKCYEFQHLDASRKPGIGTGWQHIKRGTTYTVLAIGQNTEDREPVVVYTSREDGRVWVRPLVMWFTPGRFRPL